MPPRTGGLYVLMPDNMIGQSGRAVRSSLRFPEKAELRPPSGPSVDVCLRLVPGLGGQHATHVPGVEVALLEVNATVAPRDACLIGRVREGGVGQGQILRRNRPRFYAGASGGERHGESEAVRSGEAPQDLGAGGAERAVPRTVLGERRRGERARLGREPRLAGDQLRRLVRSGPRQDTLAVIEA